MLTVISPYSARAHDAHSNDGCVSVRTGSAQRTTRSAARFSTRGKSKSRSPQEDQSTEAPVAKPAGATRSPADAIRRRSQRGHDVAVPTAVAAVKKKNEKRNADHRSTTAKPAGKSAESSTGASSEPGQSASTRPSQLAPAADAEPDHLELLCNSSCEDDHPSGDGVNPDALIQPPKRGAVSSSDAIGVMSQALGLTTNDVDISSCVAAMTLATPSHSPAGLPAVALSSSSSCSWMDT